MSFWAYMLHCRGGVFYTGHTDNLEQRIAQHQSGQLPGFASDKLPVILVWSHDFPTRLEALEAERRIKGWSRAKKLALIRGDWDRISMLAKKKNDASTSSARTVSGEMSSKKSVRPELVEGSLLLELTPHPDSPPRAKMYLSVELISPPPNQTALNLRYILTGDPQAIALPPPQTPERSHELWLHTCFEAFIRVPDEEHYLEYNFAPSRQWAMYRLSGYRDGLAEVHDAPDPEVSVTQTADSFTLDATICPDLSRGALIALTAVIEEADGTKSYWSLCHPPGEPDFHHADCFALALGAPQAA
jgi:putative endonuclease